MSYKCQLVALTQKKIVSIIFVTYYRLRYRGNKLLENLMENMLYRGFHTKYVFKNLLVYNCDVMILVV